MRVESGAPVVKLNKSGIRGACSRGQWQRGKGRKKRQKRDCRPKRQREDFLSCPERKAEKLYFATALPLFHCVSSLHRVP